MLEILDDILPRVTKPARYTGGEFNAVTKDLTGVDVKFALVFPDVYEIGMSNLGVRILYEILNRRDDVAAERVFAPWPDMEGEMREHGLPLFTLESRTPVGEFDILGFSLGYELTYTNVLNMLDLAGIPIRSSERDDHHPLVIAGGCCTCNPEPMAEFMDAFVIGEGEDVILEIIEAFKQHRSLGRHGLLKRLAHIEGVYLDCGGSTPLCPPPLDTASQTQPTRDSRGLAHVEGKPDPPVASSDSGSISRHGSESDVKPSHSIRKRLVRDLDKAQFTERPIVPFIETIHERVALEVMRGCSRGCRFCQAGMLYRPVRERSQEKLLELAKCLTDRTGYDEIGLLSLSTADYSGIASLVHTLIEEYQPRRIGVSLPSLRADAPCVELASEIRKVRKSGLTLAPEAGTQRLRDVVNKNVTEEDLLAAVEAAFRCGWKSVKLYFMIGLPKETDDDVIAIARLASDVAQVGRRMGFRPTVKVSVSTFVPKPHTPFQWRAQDTIEEIERKQALLRGAVRDKAVQLSWHDARTSALEGVLSRGDRRVGEVVYRAWKSGCRFDAWDEHFHYDKWLEAFSESGVDPEFYANRARSYDEPLPWDHIDCGISKRFLMNEDRRAEDGKVTPDCRLEGCAGCGVALLSAGCPAGKAEREDGGMGGGEKKVQSSKFKVQSSEPNTEHRTPNTEHLTPSTRFRVMLRLTKGEQVKYLSHLDYFRSIEMALRRSGIPVAYSEGFNPRPRMSFGQAIGVGVTSDDERIVIELSRPERPDEIAERMDASLPAGIRVLKAEIVPEGVKSPLGRLDTSVFRITAVCRPKCDPCTVGAAMGRMLASPELRICRVRADKCKEVDIRPHVVFADVVKCSEDCLVIEATLRSGGAGPKDFMDAVRTFIPGLEAKTVHRLEQKTLEAPPTCRIRKEVKRVCRER